MTAMATSAFAASASAWNFFGCQSNSEQIRKKAHDPGAGTIRRQGMQQVLCDRCVKGFADGHYGKGAVD